ncbi:MAG: hypothetical protein L3K10_04585 [Thermoplasmata archaeon]|nr:hypothetical protein [Thermoplasmata archaeon]
MGSREVGRTAQVTVLLVVVALGLVGLPHVGSASAASYPVLPLALDRWFVSNLTGADLAPGGSGTIAYSIGDPMTGTPLISVVLTLDVYAFNEFPGNATSTVGASAAPILLNSTASGLEVNESVGVVAPGQAIGGSVGVRTSSTTPSGAFAVRTAIRFTAGGATYLLESRGWFTSAQWKAATEGANGSVVLNVTALGVSGVVPETSILVTSSALDYALWAVLAGGVLLIAVAAWLYFRPPKSRSGVRNAPDETQAPSALGRRRTKDGD